MASLKQNWQIIVVALAVGLSVFISDQRAKTTANEVATKASKIEVARAAAIIYDGSIKVCRRLNVRPGAKSINCHKFVPIPRGVVIQDGAAVAEVDAK